MSGQIDRKLPAGLSWIAAVTASLLAAGAAPASGQLASGYSGFSNAPTSANETEYWDMMSQLGNCLAQQKPDQSRAFVDSVIGSKQEDEAFKALFHRRYNNCMGNFLNASMLRAHVRGLVAEGLFENLPDEVIARAATSPTAAPAAVVTLHDFARCYVVAHPAEAQSLLRETRVATKGEQEFIGAIASDFAPCLPAGKEVSLRPTSIRMAIAEALYRTATGKPAPTMQGTN